MNHKSQALTLVLSLVFLPALPAAAEDGVAGSRPSELKCSGEGIDVNYSEYTSVFDVYRTLAKVCSWNLQFDARLNDRKIGVELAGVKPLQALDTVMSAVGHLYKVLEGNTVLVFEDTPQNRRSYEDIVVRSFYLENVEVKQVMTALRSLLGAKSVTANEDLSSVTIRDTADRVAVAERLVLSQDRPRPEVAVDVELLRLDSAALAALLKRRGETKTLRLLAVEVTELRHAASSQSLTKLELSVLQGGEARLQAGDRVPILVSDDGSYQYQKVGLDLRIAAQVHPRNQEVTFQIRMEVSHPSYDLAAAGGAQPVFESRAVELAARLSDGETYLLTGLGEPGRPRSGVSAPPSSSLRDPFDGTAENRASEVVLLVTPRIVRGLVGEDEQLLVGTENRLTLRGDSRAVSNVAGLDEKPR